jgi:plastocyanin
MGARVTTRRAVLALLPMAGLAVACGAGAGPAAAPERKPQTHSVTIDATSYQPKSLVVHPGDTVVWVNKDFIPHTATAKGTFDSQIIQAGASWTYTASTKGVTGYACTFHPTMTGTLEVK